LPPNQSLKLTEITACFSPRENEITKTSYNTDTRELTTTIMLHVAVSLAPVLLVQCQEKKRFISFSSRVSV
jgi:hypothetical protein